MSFWRRKRRRRSSSVTVHYQRHKESAREFIHERVASWNELYGFSYNRIAIRNQRTCWGSCSEHGNLNFSYKVMFLPEHLVDYIIVHELCHLAELNHSKAFWSLVARALPDYHARKRELSKVTVVGSSVRALRK